MIVCMHGCKSQSRFIKYDRALPFDPEEDLAIHTTGFLLVLLRMVDRSNKSFLSSGLETLLGRGRAPGAADSMLFAISLGQMIKDSGSHFGIGFADVV